MENIKNLEYWLLSPFSKSLSKLIDDNDNYASNIFQLCKSLGLENDYKKYNQSLLEIKKLYQNNKLKYEHYQRKQIEKELEQMNSKSVISRIISMNVVPAANKAVKTITPVAKDIWNNTLSPATDKTLRFLTKHFVKKNK